MKEILFRGKTLPKENQDFEFNNVWVYGDLIIDKTTGKYYIHPQNNTFKTENEIAKTMVVHEVGPNTIEQFTGLCDKNGNKIFEGDIISATALDTGKERRAVVCFGNFIDENNDDEYIGFFIEFDGIKTTITQLSMEECKNCIEVIGNKYDSPELLEEL